MVRWQLISKQLYLGPEFANRARQLESLTDFRKALYENLKVGISPSVLLDPNSFNSSEIFFTQLRNETIKQAIKKK